MTTAKTQKNRQIKEKRLSIQIEWKAIHPHGFINTQKLSGQIHILDGIWMRMLAV